MARAEEGNTLSDLMPYTPPSASEIDYTWKLASKLSDTEFTPKPMRGKPEAVLACILTGRELQIGPMQSLRDVYLVNGKPSLAATLMVARVRALGHRFKTLRNTDELATVQIHRKGEAAPEPPVTFTIEDAKRAKLISKDVWQQYPARMCWARAASACCRRDCPEALGGAGYTREELEDDDAQTEATWGEPVADPVTGEVYDPIEEDPGAGAVTTTPAPAPAARMRAAQQEATAVRQRHDPTPGVPTLEQVKALKDSGEAKRWVPRDREPFAGRVKAAIETLYSGMTIKRFWDEAELPAWQHVLEYAVELHTSGAAPDPNAPGAPAALLAVHAALAALDRAAPPDDGR
jgi:hypothetical protein